jgi:ATP-dependent protease Clp ATPase subunit
MTPQNLRCDFCNKPEIDAELLIQGERALICDSCVKKAMQLVNNKQRKLK